MTHPLFTQDDVAFIREDADERHDSGFGTMDVATWARWHDLAARIQQAVDTHRDWNTFKKNLDQASVALAGSRVPARVAYDELAIVDETDLSEG